MPRWVGVVEAGGFGPLLRTCRQAAGMTQRELASRCGLTVGAIRDLEQGRSRRPQQVDAVIAGVGASGAAAAELRARATRVTPVTEPVPPGGSGPLQVRVLGPLAVLGGGVPVRLPSTARVLIARLALSANHTVPVHDLAETLWSTRVPRSPVHAVQSHISRLRSALDPASAGTLRLGAGGYRLELAEDQLDVAAFRTAVHRARSATSRPAEALALLEDATAQWRGDALADVPKLRDHPIVTACNSERIQAALLFADIAARVGGHERVLPLLRTLIVAHPLHEPLHARAMTALAAAGMRAEALTLYERIRRGLRDELGMDPGAELADALRGLLRHRPGDRADPEADAHRPAGLPAEPPHFTGRRPELRRLDDLLAAGHRAGAPLTVALTGAAGTGKSALGLFWSHRVRHDFPDGQLYADLAGFHPSRSPVPAERVIGTFLDALGVPAHRIPADRDARIALYRSRTAGRRLLIMLDDARDAEQVRPLLPAGGAGLTVVTSRDPLTGLVAVDGAEPVPVGLPPAAEARKLLAARLGPLGATAGVAQLDAVVEGCGRLPLALAVTAARVVTDPRLTLPELARRLRHAPLDHLDTGDDRTDVRIALAGSYRTLDEAAARLFRLMASDTDPSVPAGSRTSLTALTRIGLVHEPSPGRYSMHRLVHAYAVELAGTAKPDGRTPAPG